jgi:histidyl-tRNA synthetase
VRRIAAQEEKTTCYAERESWKGRKPDATSTSSTRCGGLFIDRGFEEVVIPSIWAQGTFVGRAGEEVLDQMYAFEDKRGRPICLIPEVTGIVQERWAKAWSKNRPKPLRIFYVSRCYRYERPQKGRYREFTQLGVEILGGELQPCLLEVRRVLLDLLDAVGLEYEVRDAVRRGLSYYSAPGFEIECPTLEAQKQVAGGGPYSGGVGWAIGVERLLLALER